MRRVLSVVIAVVFLGIAGIVTWLATGPHLPARTLANPDGDPQRGEMVLRLGGCVACHTDTANDGPFLAGGPPIKTQFGVFYGPNITPDEANGIGSWTLQDFAKALTHGVGPDGTHYYPVFPYDSYALMTNRDIVDLWAYIQTVEPQSVEAPEHKVGFPYSFRPILAAWQTLFVEAGPFQPDPNRDELWNRGAYIINGPGHCVACHTPRNVFGARNQSRHLEGSDSGPDGEKIPAITQAALDERGYSTSDVVFSLQTTITPDGDSLGGSMGEVISESLDHLDQPDLEAIATYLMNHP